MHLLVYKDAFDSPLLNLATGHPSESTASQSLLSSSVYPEYTFSDKDSEVSRIADEPLNVSQSTGDPGRQLSTEERQVLVDQGTVKLYFLPSYPG